MKYIYQAVSERLLGSASLIEEVGYTVAKANIRRGFAIQGDWDTLVVYYTQPENVFTDFTYEIRKTPLLVRIYDRLNDLKVDDIGEIIIGLLDGYPLNVSGHLRMYNCSYRNEIISLSWNDAVKAHEKCLLFNLIYGT